MKDLEGTPHHPEVYLPTEPISIKTERKPADVIYRTDTRQDTIPEILERTTRHGNEGQAFYAIDLGEPVRRIRRWRELLPRVEPFYAMKCNNNPQVLRTLADLGVNFDCASKEEINTILKLGVEPARIIFANPCKPITYIKYAAHNNVNLMTFDNADELHKVKEHFPEAKMVLRVLTDDSRSVCRFGLKFGASHSSAEKLLKLAKELEIDVVGVSFHVGSGCFDPTAFADAVEVARKVFDVAEAVGFRPNLLDLGGGYPGLDGVDGAPFELIAECLRGALDKHFPASSNVRIIAEPGRYVAAAAFTLATSVLARRVIPPKDETDQTTYMYYITDGVYGSFNCLLFDHAKVFPKVLRKGENFYLGTQYEAPTFETSLWGPTCDSMDCISRKEFLPELEVGDWLVFENMGAYTVAASSTFNGIPLPSLFYTNTEN